MPPGLCWPTRWSPRPLWPSGALLHAQDVDDTVQGIRARAEPLCLPSIALAAEGFGALLRAPSGRQDAQGARRVTRYEMYRKLSTTE
jgi:hypothetical protein